MTAHRFLVPILLATVAGAAAGQGYDDPPEGDERYGKLRLSTAAQSRPEGGGSFTVTIERTGGNEGLVSCDWAATAGSASAGADFAAGSGTLYWPTGDSGSHTFEVTILDDGTDEGDETIHVALSNPSGGAELASPTSAILTIVDDDQGSTANPGSLGFVHGAMQVGEGAGSMSVEVRRQGGTDGAVSVSYQSATGSASLSDYQAATGTLSWGDGQGGTRSFPLVVLDDALEEGPETVNLALSGPTGGATLGASAATLTVMDDDGTTPPPPDSCTPDTHTLCLNEDDRFLVTVTFTPPDGVPTEARAVDFGKRDSGLFFFFASSNIEMLVKVLNACTLPGFETYWVFYAATTNVAFEMTVVDTETGVVRTYTNDQGVPAPPVLDTEAFSTCP